LSSYFEKRWLGNDEGRITTARILGGLKERIGIWDFGFDGGVK
jgi:hypothetical protein